MSLSNILPAHLRVGSSGIHLPGWISCKRPDGTTSHPLGRDPNGGPGVLGLNNRTWHAIDGTCEVPLPAGTNIVAFSRKPGWHFESFEIDTAPGQLAARIIPRSLPSRPLDTLEMDLGCTGLSSGSAWFEGRASGLDAVQLFHDPHDSWTFPAMMEFSGREAAVSREGCFVQVNTRNFGAFLGTLSLLDCHRPVFPLTLEDPNFSNWSLSDWWDQCHRKRGLVIWADETTRNDPHGHGEALAGVLLGKVDAFECTNFDLFREGGIALWMDLLTLGLAPSLAGSSGTRLPDTFPGKMRSLIHLGESHWVKAVAGGKVTATLGPSMVVRFNGSHPGQPIQFFNDLLDLEAFWDPSGCPDAAFPLALEIIGSQGIFWKSACTSGNRIRAEVPLPPDTGAQISVRMTDPNGKILAMSSPFTVPNRCCPKTDNTMASLGRLMARLDETAKQLSGNRTHNSRREQADGNLKAAKLKLQAIFS